ncbi:DUF2079 domain-containing protein [Streptomyces diastatochromogenes]|nr:DUF2079 domain-containing protein [Streptomyces diastatochromogenes]
MGNAPPYVPTRPRPSGERDTAAASAGLPGTGTGARGLALTALCFLVCAGLGLQSWTALRATGFDLGIFDQAVRAYAHFELPRSPIKNVHHEFPPGFSLLGDHFTPALALLAPLYWLWDDPRTLILAQAALFAAGVPVVRRIARHAFAAAEPLAVRRAADLAGLVYALGWPLLNSSYNGFHEVAFAVPFTLLMLERDSPTGTARPPSGPPCCARPRRTWASSSARTGSSSRSAPTAPATGRAAPRASRSPWPGRWCPPP